MPATSTAESFESCCATATAPAAVVWPVRCRPTSSSTRSSALRPRRSRTRASPSAGATLSTATVNSTPEAAISAQPLPPVGAERRVVDENPRCPGLLKHLRLAGLGNGEPTRAKLELTAPDLRRLVCLRVRPELDSVRVDVGLQIGEVGLEAVDVDHRHGCLDVGQRAADLALEQLERALGTGRDLGRLHGASID